MTWYLDQVIHSASNALAGECRQASMGLAKAKLFSSSTVKQTRLCLELIIRAEPWAESHRQSPLFILLKERPPLAYLFRVFVASMERTHHPWACISTVFDLLFACPRLETRITLIIPPMLEALQIHPQHKNTWLCSKLSTLGTLSRRPISHLAVWVSHAHTAFNSWVLGSTSDITECQKTPIVVTMVMITTLVAVSDVAVLVTLAHMMDAAPATAAALSNRTTTVRSTLAGVWASTTPERRDTGVHHPSLGRINPCHSRTGWGE